MRKFIAASLLVGNVAYAEFSDSNRSINGTGEVLSKNRCEVGFRALSCGITDDLMISAATAVIITGQSESEIRYRYRISPEMRLSPAFIVGDPFHLGGRLDFGYDFGAAREHSITVTAGSDWADTQDVPVRKYGPDNAFHFTASYGGEYDFYHRGNVAYLGVLGKIGYLGYTWAWDAFHVGVITSQRSKFFPVPYFYWRF